MSRQSSRVALVTGASSGIGEATVRSFIAAGHRVVGNARNAERLASLESELGGNFRGFAGDAADADVIEQLFETAEAHFGQPADLVVVNAGRGLGGAVTTTDLSQFEALLRVNLAGAFRLMQAAANRFIPRAETEFPQKAFDIVAVGSVVGRNVSPFSAAYGSSKFALHSLVEALRREVGPKGVRVALVEPGFVVTGFQDAAGYSDDIVSALKEKFGPPLVGEDIAEAIAHLVALPPHVNVSDIVVRPTRQDYP